MAKKRLRNNRTGEIEEIEVDEDGRPIWSVPSSSKSPLVQNKQSESANDQFFSQKPGTEPGISAPTWADRIFQGVNIPGTNISIGTKDIVPTIQGIGGGVGSAIGFSRGGIKGAAVGRGVGNAVGYVPGLGLRMISPELFGSVKSSEEEARDFGLGATLDYITSGASNILKGGFPSVREQLKQRLVRRYFPSVLDAETTAAAHADPNLNLTVGQVNPEAAMLEGTFSPVNRAKIHQEQVQHLKNQLAPLQANKEDVVRVAQASARQTELGEKRLTKNLYDQFSPAIQYNTRTVQKAIPGQPLLGPNGKPIVGPTGNPLTGPTTYENIKIKGAIPLDKSKQFTDTFLQAAREELGPDAVNANTIGTTSGAFLKRLVNELEKISSTETFLDPATKQPTKTYMAFDRLKTIRDSIHRFRKSDEYTVLKDRLQGPLAALESTIREDMDEGVKGWGTNAYSRYRAAQDQYAKMATKLNPKMAEDLLKAGKDPETTFLEVGREMLKDPQMTRQAREIAGRNEVGNVFRAEFYDQASHASGGIDPARGLEFLKTKDLVAREAVPSQELSNARQLLKRAELVNQYSGGVSTALNLRAGNAALNVGEGMGTGMVTGQVPAGLIKSGFRVLLGAAGMKKFVDNVMFNNKNARIAMGTLDVDPISAKAKWGTRAILGALKGTQVIIMAPDGNKYQVPVNNNGQLDFNDSEPYEGSEGDQ